MKTPSIFKLLFSITKLFNGTQEYSVIFTLIFPISVVFLHCLCLPLFIILSSKDFLSHSLLVVFIDLYSSLQMRIVFHFNFINWGHVLTAALVRFGGVQHLALLGDTNPQRSSGSCSLSVPLLTVFSEPQVKELFCSYIS